MFCFIVKMKRKASDSKDYYVTSDSESKDSSFSVHQRDPIADPIILSDSEEVNQEIDLENDDKFDMAFNALLDEELKQMTWEYVNGFRDTLPFKKGDPLPKWFMSEEYYNNERKEMLKIDEGTRRKIKEMREKEEFEPFPSSFYKNNSKVLKKAQKCDVEDEDYNVSYRRMRDRDVWDSNDDDDDDPETPPYYDSNSEYSSED